MPPAATLTRDPRLAAMPRFLLAIVALAVLTAGCTLGTAAADGDAFVSADGTTDIAAGERQPAPEISGPTLDGSSLALADLDGPVVVNFWASWCGPCAREAPHLAAVAEQYADRGVRVVGVNVRDTIANALAFEREYDISYPSWDDESAQIASQFGALGPAGLPSTVLLDADHRVASRMFGAVTARQVAPRLDALLADAG
jgi:thiol-disulfide isomerase/thioredoxin